MRSQLFGFHIQTKFLYETILGCPLKQAHEITVQQIRKFDGLSQPLIRHHTTVVCDSYTLGLEVPLNPWNEETESIVYKLLEQHAYSDEMQQMHLLRDALSWMWPQFRMSVVAAQFLLAATIEDETHLSLLIGWNKGAAETDISFSRQFVQLYYAHLQQLQIPVTSLIKPTQTEQVPLRRYGPRLDTLEKLQKVRQIRANAKRGTDITINRMTACDKANITLATMKKYEPVLYDRWYDVTY